MEIERKWMVAGWPDQTDQHLPLLFTEYQEQGYVHARAPIVRIRLEARRNLSELPSAEAAAPAAQVTAPSASPSAPASPFTDIVRNKLTAANQAAAPAAQDTAPSASPSAPASPFTDMIEKCMTDDDAKYVLCFKSRGLLVRKEIEQDISRELFEELKDLIEKPLIRKVRRVYQLPDGLHLEVNLVDEGLPTQFMYAEVEFASEEQANAWDPAAFSLGSYLADDVTKLPGQSMSAYWISTRNVEEDPRP